MGRYTCRVCGNVYEEAKGAENWKCPNCGAERVENALRQTAGAGVQSGPDADRMTPMEWAALCTGLARGCEKQYRPEQAALFTELAAFFTSSAVPVQGESTDGLLPRVEEDLTAALPAAKAAAEAAGDRGALRALVWAEKVTRIQRSLLSRSQKQGDAMLKDRNVYVCTVCGFIAVGDAPPALCPVCKAPDWKFEQVKGR